MANEHVKIAIPPLGGEKKRDRKRQLILHCAAVLFNTKGPRATTLLDVTDKLGLTKTSLYYYVRNKEDLIYQSYQETISLLSGLIDKAEAEAPEDFLAALYCSFIDVWAAVLKVERPAFAVLSEINGLKEPRRGEIQEAYASLIHRISNILQTQIDAGNLLKTDALSAAHAYFSSLQWVVVWFTEEHLPHLADIKVAARDMIRHGLTRRGRPLSDVTFDFIEKQDLTVFSRNAPTEKKLTAFMIEASKQFNKKGYQGTSIDAISDELKVTKGAFYYHVRTKQDLLLKCFERALEQTEKSINWADKNGNDGLDKLCLALGQIFSIQNSNRGPLIGPELLYDLTPAERKRILATMVQHTETVGNFIRLGKKDGSIREVNTYVTMSILMGALFAGDCIRDWRDVSRMLPEARNYLRTFIIGTHPKIGLDAL